MSTLPTKLQQWKEDLYCRPNKELAMSILDDYLRHYNSRELQQELWRLTTAALTHPEYAATPIDRQNRLFFYEFHLLMLEALQVTLQKETKDARGLSEQITLKHITFHLKIKTPFHR